jgi:hypothetical protein
MQYRKFGRLDWRTSALGFGCMRFPTTDGKPSGRNIDKSEATRMVRLAIDRGVNYIDTAYPYHGGRSEALVGRILGDGYRERVRLATKSPIWLIKKQSDFDKYLDQQLRRLRTDHIDFYLFHGLRKETWEKVVLRRKLLARADRAIGEGKIDHVGFSFHDKFAAFKQIVDGYDGWDFCQIQYNYMDVKNQAGTRGLKYAASKGLGVVVMEPLLGGRLATPPREINTMIRESGAANSPADLALQWLWDQPEVSLVLSGMSTMGQVRGNLISAERSRIGALTGKERSLIERVRKEYESKAIIPCTKCEYCMPCPHGVRIPLNFTEYNDGFIYNDLESARRVYAKFMSKKIRASSCKGCRKCEEKCPQGIRISEWMPKVDAVLGRGKPYPRR